MPQMKTVSLPDRPTLLMEAGQTVPNLITQRDT